MRTRLTFLFLAALTLPTLARAAAVPESVVRPAVASSQDYSALEGRTHRVIVRLATPPLAQYAASEVESRDALYDDEGLLYIDSPSARAHLQLIAIEQEAFLEHLSKALPHARVDHYIDGSGQRHPLRWSIVVNGMTITAGRNADVNDLVQRIRQLPGVVAAGAEGLRALDMYDSLSVVRAIEAWENDIVGGASNAGRGIRVASADCGAHRDVPMLDGTGFDYPPGYPLGDVANTNGKIIVSRAYFRSYDPPARGEELPWPGPASSSHGVHTIGSAVGNVVQGLPANAEGEPETIAGIAPAAYVMSYRICYAGTYVGPTSIGDAEAITAHEDLVRDRAHVVNNSWGGGPLSIGGIADATDVALENAWRAGVFVTVSNGNSGPLPATMDHPSPLYVNVANSTKGSMYASTGLSVTGPPNAPVTLVGIPFALGQFGPIFDEPTYGPYMFKPAIRVADDNFEGCEPWPEGTFTGTAALISRGTCSFNQKVLNAERAGAEFVVIHNHLAGGDALTNMITDDEVVATIHSIFVGYTSGTRLLGWYDEHPDGAELTMDSRPRKLTNQTHPALVPPGDRIASGSSRGPAAGNVLKPDLAAPGTAILSQGFGPSGPSVHAAFGQATGTSMAAPHVAGAAAILRAEYPDWNIAQIKSALMGTAQYLNIHNINGQPAQPLDMGAGRLDVAAALEPALLAEPPSLSFGQVEQGSTAVLNFTLTNIWDEAATFELRARDTRGGFEDFVNLDGLVLVPEQVTIPAKGTVTVEARWDTSATTVGDQQGYVVVSNPEDEIHLPAWIRVASPPSGKEVLLIDHDGAADVVGWYTETLDAAFIAHDVWDVDAQLAGGLRALPRPESLSAYDWILFQSSKNNVPLPPAYTLELNEYLNAGGRMAIFGENAHVIFNESSLFWDRTLGASTRMNHTITGGRVFTDTLLPLLSHSESPFASLGVRLDLSGMGDGAANQDAIHEVDFDSDTTPLFMHTLPPSHKGLVAAAKKREPSLEVPGVDYPGRTMLFNFGLEGVNNDISAHSSRADIIFAVKAWLQDTVSVSAEVDAGAANAVTYFTVTVRSSDATPTGARIDFGDGSAPSQFAILTNPDLSYNVLGFHVYRQPGTYTVTLEGTDSFGTVALSQMEIVIDGTEPYVPDLPKGGTLALPWLSNNATLGTTPEGP